MNATCGCCTGTEVAVPVSEVNAPGLAALTYRTGTYATFLETMLARLTAVPALTTRDPSDPSIALLDAWAVVADVLTFYQERIANEGYLPTALERRSLLELARLIGYRLRPGVAASVKLAFTVSSGFQGSIPAGTRAQSVPGAGESPQYFETSAAFEARDVWNSLAPRLTRPTVITPAPGVPPAMIQNQTATDQDVTPTAVDLIDTIYVDGVTTNLKPGNALLFVFGGSAGEQYLRMVEDVDAQATPNRTELTLAPDPSYTGMLVLYLFLAKAEYGFPGSDVAASITQILTVLLGNLSQGAPIGTAVALLRAALPQVALQRAIADARGFTRVSAFVGQLVRALETLIVKGTASGTLLMAFAVSTRGKLNFAVLPGELAGSPLARLGAIVAPLALPPSVQPANALRLTRSVAQSFAPQSDLAPRLIAALKPAVSGSLYAAWSAVATPTGSVEVFAARVKATLFASGFTGAATVASGKTSFAAPAIASAWGALATATNGLGTIALDTPYDQIAAGTWIAIDRPELDSSGAVQGRTTTYHVVTATRTANLDTTTGYSAKTTLLSLAPPWLSEAAAPQLYTTSTPVLRETVVYAQAEALTLIEEPLDTDVEGAGIDLDDVYAGLEAGRWIIVSGTRTDIPNTSGVAASELAMIAGVEQGAQAPLSATFPLTAPPFAQVFYTTAADANGDRLVVGQLAARSLAAVEQLPLPQVLNQQYSAQIELAPGLYVNAYVPSAAERAGSFPSFEGMLVDPTTHVPYAGGSITSKAGTVVAWRISDEKLHTVLTLATALAYSYDRASLTIYGNVTDATHGQSTGEVLGNGAATRAFATFGLSQSPLTYVSSPTAVGTTSTLTVRVNELQWNEVDDLAAAGPAQRVYVTREDDAGSTSVTFGDGVHGVRPPTGTANVKATYRYGIGAAGNVDAAQISQLATHPLGAQGVLNPLAATGGADADSLEQARANAPLAVMALDRLVSVRDYADFARTYAGIGKAVAARISDGRELLVHVTVAGAGDIPIDPSSDLYANLLQSLQTYGDPYQPVAVDVRSVRLIVMSATVGLSTGYAWEDVAPKVRAALLAVFAFDARALGQAAFQSEAVLAAQSVEGVAFVNVTVFDGVPENITVAQLAALGSTLRARQYVRAQPARIDPAVAPGSPGRIEPAELVFMTPDIPDTLILTEGGS
jgi:hypothetical protein